MPAFEIMPVSSEMTSFDLGPIVEFKENGKKCSATYIRFALPDGTSYEIKIKTKERVKNGRSYTEQAAFFTERKSGDVVKYYHKNL